MSTSVAPSARLAETPLEDTRILERIPPMLSILAGMVEVIGFLMLGGLFTGHVTGNIVLIAALLVRGGSPTPPQILALPTFIGALVVTWVIARASQVRGAALVRNLLIIQCLLLLGVLLLAINPDAGSDPNSGPTSIAAALATCAMACQFATLRLGVPGAPSTAVMTGNLTNAVLSFLDLVHPGTAAMPVDAARFRKASTLVVGFCAGCVAGALAISLLSSWSWALPVALSAAVVALVHRPAQLKYCHPHATKGVAMSRADQHNTDGTPSVGGVDMK